eukprot:PhM_4_TR13650/c0_g1_i2/m.15887
MITQDTVTSTMSPRTAEVINADEVQWEAAEPLDPHEEDIFYDAQQDNDFVENSNNNNNADVVAAGALPAAHDDDDDAVTVPITEEGVPDSDDGNAASPQPQQSVVRTRPATTGRRANDKKCCKCCAIS